MVLTNVSGRFYSLSDQGVNRLSRRTYAEAAATRPILGCGHRCVLRKIVDGEVRDEEISGRSDSRGDLHNPECLGAREGNADSIAVPKIENDQNAKSSREESGGYMHPRDMKVLVGFVD